MSSARAGDARTDEILTLQEYQLQNTDKYVHYTYTTSSEKNKNFSEK
jgi:hypothetical protein